MSKTVTIKPMHIILAAGLTAFFLLTNFKSLTTHYAQNKIFENVENYTVSSTYYSKIYYTDVDYEYMETVKRLADTYFPILQTDFGLVGADDIHIIIYPNKEALSRGVGMDYSEKPPMGVYCGGVINVLSPRNWAVNQNEVGITEKFIQDGPIIHELSHYFLDEKTKGNYEIWFSEGLALYYEYKYLGFQWRQDLENCSENITINDMKSLFSQSADDFAYRCAFEKVYGIVETHGASALADIFKSLESGTRFDKTIAKYQ